MSRALRRSLSALINGLIATGGCLLTLFVALEADGKTLADVSQLAYYIAILTGAGVTLKEIQAALQNAREGP